MNAKIANPAHHLRFNNHRTSEADSRHKEQRRSASYYALTKQNIPAFGVEASKAIPDLEAKIRNQSLVVTAFLDELGIVPETPRTQLNSPQLKFLVISVNGRLPMVVSEGDPLTVQKGDRIKVLHIEANYERGLSCDLLGQGTVNDYRQEMTITGATSLIVRKDNQRKANQVHVGDPPPAPAAGLAGPAVRPCFISSWRPRPTPHGGRGRDPAGGQWRPAYPGGRPDQPAQPARLAM